MNTSTKRIINVRPEADFYEVFTKQTELLGVTESELARRSMRYGFNAAVEEIAAEKQKEAKTLLSRLSKSKMVRGRGFEPLTPTVSR